MGDRPVQVDEKKSDRKLEREKKKRRHFLLEEKHENFVAVARKWKMLAATKVKIRGRGKKVNKNTYDISSIKRVTRNFLVVSRRRRARQRQRNVQKKCASRAKLLFC